MWPAEFYVPTGSSESHDNAAVKGDVHGRHISPRHSAAFRLSSAALS